MEIGHGGDIYAYEKDVVDFSSNISPLGLNEDIADSIIEAVPFAVRYPDVRCGNLRRLIAEAEGVREDEIICSNGAAELIFDAARAIKPRGALLSAPCFSEYERAAKAAGAEISYYMTRMENGFKTDGDYLELITEGTDMLFICNPNNPTGTLVEPEFIDRIIDRAKKTNTLVVIDECFNDFLDEPKRYSALSRAAENKNVLILKAFTKMYAMPGIRLGYGITSDGELIEKIYAQRQPWSVSGTAQAAGAAAMRHKELPKVTREYVRREREYLTKELDRLGIIYIRPSANYIFFVYEKGLKERLLEKNILIRDCSNYTGLQAGSYRIAVKKHSENERLIKELEKITGR